MGPTGQVLENYKADGNRLAIQLFLYLQLLDVLTTLVGFRLGAREASPFVRVLMGFGPVWGVLCSKLVALGLGALILVMRRGYLIGCINYWYAALVAWNLFIVLSSSRAA